MSDQAQPTAKPKRPRAAKKPGAAARPRPKAKDAATGETIASPRTPVSVVPEIPPPAAPARRASAARLGLLTATLALMIAGLAWFNEAPDFSGSNPFRTAFSPLASAEPADSEPPAARVGIGIEQEMRLATIALEIRESQESLARLWDDARSLANSVGTLTNSVGSLASGVQSLKADVNAGLERMEGRLHDLELASAPELVRLGDPALRGAALLGDPEFAQAETAVAQASEVAQPTTTGGLPEIEAPPQATVRVTLAKPKPRKTLKAIGGWQLHNVRNELALVEGDGSFYEVKAGEELPGAGIVRSIKKRGEKWVVLTNKGLITEPK
jgi:hypothetical protein